jgi:DNA repair exonuclease SbcCD ATPase subunit
MLSVRPPAVVALALLVLCLQDASAQVQRSGGGASAQLMQQYQQLASERTHLQEANAKLKKDLDDATKQLDASKKQLDEAKKQLQALRGTSQQLATVQATSDSNAKQLAQLKASTQELITRFKATIASLQQVETERGQLQQQLSQSKSAYDKCAQTNYDLYQVADEVLNRYAHEGPFSCAARAEPFTQLHRTRIDNLVLEYRQRAEELQMKKPTAQSGATPPPQSGATPPTQR